MGLMKSRHGTYYAQRKVPERLQEAVARVLNTGRDRQVFLKKSLGTKKLKATHVLAGFDRTLADAEALLKERPVIPTINNAQIKRMAESYYAAMLANDEGDSARAPALSPSFRASRSSSRLRGLSIKLHSPKGSS